MARDLTYATADAYLLDLLACHDHRIRHHANAMFDHDDGQSQLSTLAIMRALLPHFTNRELRHGPFILMLTDLHPSNVFVDADWRITSLVDLEWACSRPVEMLLPPHWLTGRTIDGLTGEHLVAFSRRYDDFVAVFDEEEKKRKPEVRGMGGVVGYADTMRTGLKTGRFWYLCALETLNGVYHLFLQHIQPVYGTTTRFDSLEFERLAAPYWAPGAEELISEKLRQRERYQEQIREVFARGEDVGERCEACRGEVDGGTELGG